jgi:serine/threonine-protein kinase
VFAVQEEIAQSVADLLRLHIPEGQGAVRPTIPNHDAYLAYLRARFLIHQQIPEALQAALEQLRKLDGSYPNYALAYSGMAAATGLLSLFGVVSGRDIYPEVKANAERGYELDPESGETCTIFAGLRGWFEYRWQEANTLYDRALKLQPSHAPAHMFRAMVLLCQGNIKAAEAGLYRSAELDPLSASDSARMAYVQYVKGDYPAAAEHLRHSFELDRDYPEARFYEGLLHYEQQQYDAVIQCLSPSVSPLDIGLVAAAHAREGSLSLAEESIERLDHLKTRQYVTPLAEGLGAIGMENFDLAFECLTFPADSLGTYAATGPIPSTNQKIEIARKPAGTLDVAVVQPLSTQYQLHQQLKALELGVQATRQDQEKTRLEAVDQAARWHSADPTRGSPPYASF